MTKDLSSALSAVEGVYGDVVRIADDMLKDIVTPMNNIAADIRDNAAGLSAESIRDYIVRLQLRCFELADVKERSTLKADCAEALRKEKYAKEFNAAEGTSGIRENTATINASEEIVVEALYNLISNSLKTKLDEGHRLIDALKSILMSKMQEAKLTMAGAE